MAKGFKRNRIFRKEYIPIGIAILVLIVLITALVITIINKPTKKEQEKENDASKGFVVSEKVVPENNTCDSEEFNKFKEEAKKTFATYEVDDHVYLGNTVDINNIDNPEVENYGYGLHVFYFNIPENGYIRILNDQDDKVLKCTYEDSAGCNYITTDTDFLKVITVEVYSNLDSCKDVLIREFDFTLPRWNELFKLPVCNDTRYYDEVLCQPFIFEPFDFNKDLKKRDTRIAQVNKEIKEKEEKEKKQEEVKKNLWVYIVIGIFVIIILIGVVVIIKKGRRK